MLWSKIEDMKDPYLIDIGQRVPWKHFNYRTIASKENIIVPQKGR